MRDPGLDRHEWATEFEQLEPLLEDAPAEALPELADLVERMMIERGLPINDPVADEGIEPAILVEFRSAREISDRADRGESVDPGDLGEAIHSYRDIYQHLITELNT